MCFGGVANGGLNGQEERLSVYKSIKKIKLALKIVFFLKINRLFCLTESRIGVFHSLLHILYEINKNVLKCVHAPQHKPAQNINSGYSEL